MGKKKADQKKCGCIFCNAKCPECGSTDIEITFTPEYQLTNDTKNELHVCNQGSHIEIKCEACGESFDGDTDERLAILESALARHLGIADHIIEIGNHGKIKTSHEKWVTKD